MKIKSGNHFTLLLTDRGEVYSWGKNKYGQLGIGIIDDYYHTPSKIKFSLGVPIRYISVGYNHAAATDYSYNVYIWGHNNYGQLGLGDNVDRYSPTIIENLTEKKIEKIYCKYRHTFALTQNGEVYSWGSNNYGNSGIGKYINVNTPAKIFFPNNTIIKKLYIGYYHAFAIDTCSKIYSWSDNNYHQLYNDNEIRQIANILEGFNVKKIICLTDSTIILADNKLYSIGRNESGELGLGIEETNILTLVKEGVEKVWGKGCTVFCKMCNGDIYAWGFNSVGQLGIGNKLNQNTPVKLNIGLDIKSINHYSGATYAITTSGEIYTWGLNVLVNEELIMEPVHFTYFTDNDIDVKSMNRTKSARKIDR